MTRVRSLLTATMALALGAAMVGAAEAQMVVGGPGGPPSPTIRGRPLIGLVTLVPVQMELKLSEESVTKVREIDEKINEERGKWLRALGKIEDRQEKFDKLAEMKDATDRMTRRELRTVLTREQRMRLFEIFLQGRPVFDSLSEKYVADGLKLTGGQRAKLAEIGEESYTKELELFVSIGGASQQQRFEARKKFGQIRAEAGQKAFELLTAKQKKSFEKMKGEKFEL